ncbi:MAG TPA: CDF family Co(II)/Ni(II) efflux transporter DmeF [Syntrophobacteraceae bacterium]|nr:CDF family Co(II)/Ni(II) efflux transporter DmeF [Syntrophobacteraceae bacterium]
MHGKSIEQYQHEHFFLGEQHVRNERMTWTVIALCAVMMAAEILGGLWFGSMALIADGLHMSTHAGALLIAALAYTLARMHQHDERFAFGTGKFGDLAAFSSALILAMIALLIGWESFSRLLHPVPIAFNQAIFIAALGLGVNLLSARLLGPQPRDGDNHGLHDDAGHHHSPPEPDLNLRAAYVHVLADAAVSLMAVAGLTAARLLGWVRIDPVMGIIGACVIMNWSWSLLRQAGSALLDVRPDAGMYSEIRRRLEKNGDRVADLHVWRVGPGHLAAAISIVSDRPEPTFVYKERLAGLPGLTHSTIEIQHCCPQASSSE